MSSINKQKRIQFDKFCATMLCISVVLHIILFVINNNIGAIECDEAMTLLNARCLADGQVDSLGERLPVYFDTWLRGGQSPFATYLVALFIKVFGYSITVSRLPMLLISLAGLIAFYCFLDEIFEKDDYKQVAFALACFSPWHLHSSVYTLDCSFLPHILIFGLLFLAKGINEKKSIYFVISMLFFALGFYCYIAAAFIIPIILAVLYLMLLIQKKISVKQSAVSVVSLTVFSIPFILFGLVQLKIIDSFTLFGFSYSYMPLYNRAETFQSPDIVGNLTGYLSSMLIPDFYDDAIGVNSFLYTNLVGGLFLLLGLIKLLLSSVKKETELKTANAFAVAIIISSVVFSSLTFFPTTLYRYFSYNYILIMIEAIGIVYLCSILKKLNCKKLVTVFVTLSLIVSGAVYYYQYTIKLNNNSWYMQSFSESMDFAKSTGCKSIGFSFDNVSEARGDLNQRASVYLRLYWYDNIENFSSFKDEQLAFGYFDNNPEYKGPLTYDNSLYYKELKKSGKTTDKCIVFFSDQEELLNYDSNRYEIRNFGVMSVLYKK